MNYKIDIVGTSILKVIVMTTINDYQKYNVKMLYYTNVI